MKKRLIPLGFLLALLPLAFYSRGLIERRLQSNLKLQVSAQFPIKIPGTTPANDAFLIKVASSQVENLTDTNFEWQWQKALFRPNAKAQWRPIAVKTLPEADYFFQRKLWFATPQNYDFTSYIEPMDIFTTRKFAAGEWNLTARLDASFNDHSVGFLYQGSHVLNFKVRIASQTKKYVAPVVF